MKLQDTDPRLDFKAMASEARAPRLLPSESMPGLCGAARSAESVWWASALKEHTRNMGLIIPPQRRPIRVISCCSGSCAEAVTLEDHVGLGH